MNNDLAEIKKQVSLARVVAERVKLENRGGEFWGCCPFHTEKTPSFAVKNKGGEEVFFCQGCGKGGDVIRFIEYIEHCTTKEAIRKLREKAGTPEMAAAVQNRTWQSDAQKVGETFHNVADEKPKVTVSLSKWPTFEQALLSNKEAIDWLKKTRGLSLETVKTLRLGFAQSYKGRLNPEDEHAREGGWVMFPRIKSGIIIAVKMRALGAKAFGQWPNMDAKALFNLETINPLEPVFVTEGEFDTAIMEQAGFRAVSSANSTTKLTPENKTLLKGAECVFLAGDNDGKVGNAAMRQLQRELGENTFMLLWPGAKDANQYFLEKCGADVEVFRKEVEKLIVKARSTPIEGFTSLLERLRSTGGSDAGSDPNRLHFPIPALDRMNYNPPGSVVVIYSTYSGTGKTIFTTQIMLSEAKRGEIVVVFSPELRDEQYLALVAAQTLEGGLNRAGVITRQQYEETANILDKPTDRATDFRYYVGHSLPETETEKVMDFIEQTIKVTGATRFVIDTLHRVIEKTARESQTDAEGRVVKQLENLGIKYGTIFILIGQSNKEAEDVKELRKDTHGTLRGSRELSDVAYGVYLMHRKKRATEGNPKELLELETDIVLKKDRGKGPGNAIVHLIYRPECSKFYELQRDSPENGQAPLASDTGDSDQPF